MPNDDKKRECQNCGWIGIPRKFESVATKDDAQGAFVLYQCGNSEVHCTGTADEFPVARVTPLTGSKFGNG